MARYNVRDWLGHWIARPGRKGAKCPHDCCIGVLPVHLLRAESDQALYAHYRRYANHDKARHQIEAEVTRRENAARRSAAAAERKASRERAAENKAGRAAARRQERESEREYLYLSAEQATKGYMLSKAGRRAGVSPRSLFGGSAERARRYASPELLAYWEKHPRTIHTSRRQRQESQLTPYGVY